MQNKTSIDIKSVAKDFLKSHGISPSVQRLEILTFLLVTKTHPSVDEIYGALKDDIPTLSKTTVYNTLKLFQKSELIQSITIDSKEERFDIAVKKHAHFLCSKCGEIEDVDDSIISEVLNVSLVNENKVDFSMVNFIGVCKGCLK